MFKVITYLAQWDDLYVAQGASPAVRSYVPPDLAFTGREGDVIVTRLARDERAGVNRGRTVMLITPADQPLAGIVLHDHLRRQLAEQFKALVDPAGPASDPLLREIREYCEVLERFLPQFAPVREPSTPTRPGRAVYFLVTIAALAATLAVGALYEANRMREKAEEAKLASERAARVAETAKIDAQDAWTKAQAKANEAVKGSGELTASIEQAKKALERFYWAPEAGKAESPLDALNRRFELALGELDRLYRIDERKMPAGKIPEFERGAEEKLKESNDLLTAALTKLYRVEGGKPAGKIPEFERGAEEKLKASNDLLTATFTDAERKVLAFKDNLARLPNNPDLRDVKRIRVTSDTPESDEISISPEVSHVAVFVFSSQAGQQVSLVSASVIGDTAPQSLVNPPAGEPSGMVLDLSKAVRDTGRCKLKLQLITSPKEWSRVFAFAIFYK